MNKNPFLFTPEEKKEFIKNYDSTKCSISHMNNWQKYKNKYSRIRMKAQDLCRHLGK
ncbi:hypothetical protein LGL08_05215 [Clostridium estertheticum]|uniref:hypothetical protein n=1 Tax=Clostridium estertheticum TaxID=238834 RepID=UPI001CF2EE22|nr:hypothetical protein [Clostridium estertheticum]MCB2306070.1 hypothetical protein [Clostridium estertheticum]MCB2346593.1 hypothetical protein [Clostridium estertheticum]MCB2348959.1 hypothetical protein [Clostridium estertheticum]